MNMTNLRIRGRVVAVTLLLLICRARGDTLLTKSATAQDGLDRRAQTLHIAALRDVSTSMKGDGRHQAAGEALKLAATLLEGRFTIIDFSDHARATTFDLPAQHRQVFEAVDRTPIAGGTSYLAALREMPPGVSAAVFLSDGEPSENPEEIATFLKTVRCPIHTIAVNAAAEEVLRKMAATTGGGFYRASDVRSLVDAFLRILSQVASLRTTESMGPPIELDSVAGKLLCIGINAQPTIQVEGLSTPFRPERNGEHVFRLPEARVHVSTRVLDSPSNVSVTLGPTGSTGPAQLIVATLADSRLDLELTRTESGKVLAKAQFVGSKSPAHGTPVKSTFTVLGKDGQVKQVVDGKRVGNDIVAEIDAPQGPDYDVRVETIDAKGGRRVASRAISGNDIPPATPVAPKSSPSPKPTDEAPATVLSEGAVDLLLVAHRAAGDVVLAQSGQDFSVTGLTGIDRVLLQVVRGAMDPRVFAALAHALQVRWLREDGGVVRSGLRLADGDRYTTEPISVDWQGQLTCELRFGSPGTTSTLKVEATFLPVTLQLRDTTTHPIPSSAFEGTVIRPEFALDVLVGDRPATQDERAEVFAVEVPKVTISLEDRTESVLRESQHELDKSGRVEASLILSRVGTFGLVARLEGQGSGRVWAEVKWPTIRVTPSPLGVSLCQRNEGGGYLPVATRGCPSWVPSIFRKRVEGLFYTVRLRRDRPTPCFIDSLSTKDHRAEFDPENGCYALPAAGVGQEVCTVTFGSIDSNGLPASGSALPVRLELVPPVPYIVCWGRLAAALAFLVFLPLTVILGRSFQTARRLRSRGTYATVIGGPTFDSRPLVPQDRFWPSTKLFVLREGDMYQLAYPRQPRNGATVIARMRQLADGNVLFRTVENLSDFPAETTRVLEPGAADVELDEFTILSVNVGEKSPH